MIGESFKKPLLAIIFIFIGSQGLLNAKPYALVENNLYFFAFQQADTTNQDSTKSEQYTPTRRPTYQQKDRFGDPFSNNTSTSPLLLKDPSSLNLDVEIDTGMNYTIYEKIGDLNYRPTSSMTFEEFKQYQERQQLKEYWFSLGWLFRCQGA